MASRNDGKKKSAASRAFRFARRLTLCAAFAAVAGGGYDYLGTQDDITAKVTSVEASPGGQIIHTDKGDFANTATWVFQKDEGVVEKMATVLQPGAEVKLRVYGAHPVIGKYSPDNAGLYRNITGVTVLSEPAPVITAPVVTAPIPAPVKAPKGTDPAALVVPASLVNADGIDKEDPQTPEACAANDDFNAISAKLPRIARDLSIMERLPQTGVPVFDNMKKPQNHMQTCEFPADPLKGSTSSYKDNHARVARGTGSSTMFHEYFHAFQDVNEGSQDMYSLTEKDAVVANLLKEASAVAYELSSRQEALNHGIKFYDPPAIVKTWQEGDVVHIETYSETAPATNPLNRQAYKDAYDAAFAANAGLAPDAREAAALQAGGQAIVRRLLTGADKDWNQTYQQLVMDNINKNLAVFSANNVDPSDPGYAGVREHVFNAQGTISSTINFVPPEYFGPGADAAVDKAFTNLGFNLNPAPPPASTPAAPPTQPPSP